MDDVLLFNLESLAVLGLLLLVAYWRDRDKFEKRGILILRHSHKWLGAIERFAKRHRKKIRAYTDACILASFGLLGLVFLFNQKKPETKKKLVYILVLAGILVLLYPLASATTTALKAGSLEPVVHASTILAGISGLGLSTLAIAPFQTASGKLEGPAMSLVLPIKLPEEVKIPVMPVPIVSWLLCIGFILVVHEFGHAIAMRAENVKVKSIGYGFFGPLPLGFAEPDDESMKKASPLARTRIYSVGSINNILSAILVGIAYLALAFAVGVALGAVYGPLGEQKGVIYTVIHEENKTYPSSILPEQGVITRLDNVTIKNTTVFQRIIEDKKPGQNITLTIYDGKQEKNYTLTLASNPENKSRGFIGINIRGTYTPLKKELENTPVPTILGILSWIEIQIRYLLVLSIGIGIANLLPIIPLDGGLMLREELGVLLGDRGRTIAEKTAILAIVLLVANLLLPIVM